MFKKIPSYFFYGLVRAYQVAASPIFGGACRFEPSCSHYAIAALREHSVIQAIKLISLRLLKCRPFGPSGYDPVPTKQCQCGGSYGSESR